MIAINDSRPIGNDHRLIKDGQKWPLNSAIDNVADVQVPSPNRIDLTVEDGQPHLGAITEESVRVAVAA